jgi:hypothetical protein
MRIPPAAGRDITHSTTDTPVTTDEAEAGGANIDHVGCPYSRTSMVRWMDSTLLLAQSLKTKGSDGSSDPIGIDALEARVEP